MMSRFKIIWPCHFIYIIGPVGDQWYPINLHCLHVHSTNTLCHALFGMYSYLRVSKFSSMGFILMWVSWIVFTNLSLSISLGLFVWFGRVGYNFIFMCIFQFVKARKQVLYLNLVF